MKFKRLNDNRLQIIISNKDLLARNMKKWDLVPHNPNAQELFQEILEQAAKDCDFEVLQDTQLIVEAYPITGESLLMTITKVNDTLDALSQIVEDDLLKITNVKKTTGLQKDFESGMTFVFDSLEDIIEFAHELGEQNVGNTSIYKNHHDDGYILKIENIELIPSTKQGRLYEYAVEKHFSQAYLNEHCDFMIGPKAIDKLKLI